MKRLSILLILLATSPAWATFTLVQKVVNNACGTGTTCAITTSATGSGNIIFIGVAVASGTKTISSISAGGTFAHCTGTDASVSGTNSSDAQYTLSSTGGVTSMTVTINSSAGAWVAEMQEWSFTGTPSIDVCGSISNSTTTNRGGVDLTALTGSNDLLYQVIESISGITVTAINGAYSNTDLGARYGFAAAANSTTGTAPTWTWTGGNAISAGSGIAIKETAGTPSIIIGGLIQIN